MTPLRQDLLSCFDAALAAAEPRGLVRAALAARSAPAGPAAVLACGKAAAAMAWGAQDALAGRIAEGLAILPHGWPHEPPPGWRQLRAAHPLPDASSLAAARAAAEMAERAAARRRPLLCLLSGGASALIALPPAGIALEDLRVVTGALLRAGADIRELNCVRKHLDRLKGGGLAWLAAPAPVTALLLSDVVDDRLDAIASGPLAADETTFADAAEILARHGLWSWIPSAVRDRIEAGCSGRVPETVKPGDPCLHGVQASIVGGAATAAEGARARAAELGYGARITTTTLTGEARDAGRQLAQAGRALQPTGSASALISAGETTVTVRGAGRGGRNQELVLAAALALEGAAGISIGSLGTDGVDGPTDAAGAVADGTSVARGRALGLDAAACLEQNDSATFFAALGDQLRTGPTGTNVMDLQLVLVRGESGAPLAAGGRSA